MQKRACSPAVVLAALLLAAGCSSSGTNAPPGGRSTAVAPTAQPVTTPATTPPATPNHTKPSGPGSPAAHARIAAAITQAESSGKRVLIDFGAGWCVDCRALDKLFENHRVAPKLEEGFVVAHVNVHNFNFNMDISDTYGQACKGGIPALVVLDGQGQMLVNTHDGSFESASTFGPGDVLKFLNRWAP